MAIPGRLVNKVVFITGAAQGIGKASALRCDDEGAKVIAVDVNMDKLLALQQERGSIHVARLDVTDRAAVEGVLSQHPDINVLFNCAGCVCNGTIEQAEEREWDLSFTLNVKSLFYSCKYCIAMWRERGVPGSIINMSSVASSLKGVVNRCAYSASKAAVIGLSKSIAADYVKDNIRCNTICPGTIDTPSLQDRLAATGDYERARAAFVARQPMGRLGTATEVANMLVYLASDESSFVTGSDVVIDGGWSM